MLPTIDRSNAPLLVVRFPPNVTDEELGRHFDTMVQVVLGGPDEQVTIIVDLTQADLFSLALRDHAAAKLKAIYPRVAGRIAGAAHIVGSPFGLGAMTGVLALVPAPHPTLVTRSLEAGTLWAQRRLSATRPAARV